MLLLLPVTSNFMSFLNRSNLFYIPTLCFLVQRLQLFLATTSSFIGVLGTALTWCWSHCFPFPFFLPSTTTDCHIFTCLFLKSGLLKFGIIKSEEMHISFASLSHRKKYDVYPWKKFICELPHRCISVVQHSNSFASATALQLCYDTGQDLFLSECIISFSAVNGSIKPKNDNLLELLLSHLSLITDNNLTARHKSERSFPSGCWLIVEWNLMFTWVLS